MMKLRQINMECGDCFVKMEHSGTRSMLKTSYTVTVVFRERYFPRPLQ